MLADTQITITKKLDEAFDLNHILIDEEIENAVNRYLDIDKKHWNRIHNRILLALNINSEHDSKYYSYEKFETLFQSSVEHAKPDKFKMIDLDDEFMLL